MVKRHRLVVRQLGMARQPALTFGPQRVVERRKRHGADHFGHRIGNLAAERAADAFNQRDAAIGLGLVNPLDDEMPGIAGGGDFLLAGECHFGELGRAFHQPRLPDDPARHSGFGGGIGLAELALLEHFVEPEILLDHAFERGGAEAGVERLETGEGKAGRGKGRRSPDHGQRDPRLDPQCAAIAGEQASKIGAIVAREGRGLGRDRAAGAHQLAGAGHDLEAQRSLGGAALAVADRVHRHRATDIGEQARIRTPEPRLEPAREDRFAQLGPGHPGLDRDGCALLVDDDGFEPRGIDRDAAGRAMRIGIGVTRPAAAHDQRCARFIGRAHHGLQFLDRAGADDSIGQLAGAEDVVGIEQPVGITGQDMVAADMPGERGKQGHQSIVPVIGTKSRLC